MTDLDLGLFPLRPEPGEPKPPRKPPLAHPLDP